MQLRPRPEQEPSLSSPSDESRLQLIKKASPASLNSLQQARNTIDTAEHIAAGIPQFFIPRKPVGSGRPVGGSQPIGSNENFGISHPVGRSQDSTLNLQPMEIRARRAHILKDWWLESGACFLLLGALVAVIATLYPHQGKPLPQWPYRISVNTLVSIHLAVLKGNVLLVTAEGLGQLKWRWLQNNRPLEDLSKYDQATRGPLGALILLWRLRQRLPLSSAGTLVALLILAVDPFTQQIIHYYDCSVSIDSLQGTIPRTNVYLQRNFNQSFSNSWIEPGLQAAINSGVVSPSGRVNAKCATGNCTFNNEHSTVGYCSSCTDITEHLFISSTVVKSNYTNTIPIEVSNSTGAVTNYILTGP